jgi:hypothetical protein
MARTEYFALWLATIPYIRRINDLEAHLPGSLFAMIP